MDHQSQVRGRFTSNYLNYLIAFRRQVYREIELTAVTLMTSRKTRAPELKAIARDFYGSDKAPF